MKRLSKLLVILLAASTLVGCTKAKEEKVIENKVNVKVTIDPLKQIAEEIGGDNINVTTMVPSGGEPHDFEPKTKDLVELNKSDLFIYNGLGMEEWLDKVMGTIESDNVKVIDSSTGANILEYGEESEEEHGDHEEHEEHGEEDHVHGKIDPHLWLSLKEVKVQANNIKNALIDIDVDNKASYEERYNSFVSSVDGLYNEYYDKFNSLSNKDFVTGHAAFGYLCRDFGLTQMSVENLFGEGEITPQRMKALVDYSLENNVKTIFMPELASPKVSETLAKEVGAKVESIYSLETQPENMKYIEAMEYNLQKVYENLK